jgi:hypothetical protein
MTLFIVVPCTRGVVLSADSRVTRTDTGEVADGELKIQVLDRKPPVALCLAGRYEIAGLNAFDGNAIVQNYLRRDPSPDLAHLAQTCGLELAERFGRHLNERAPHLWTELLPSPIHVGLFQVRADGTADFGNTTLRATTANGFTTSPAFSEARQNDKSLIWKIGGDTSGEEFKQLVMQIEDIAQLVRSNLTVGQVDVQRARQVGRAIVAAAAKTSRTIGGPIKTLLLEHDRSTLLDA